MINTTISRECITLKSDEGVTLFRNSDQLEAIQLIEILKGVIVDIEFAVGVEAIK